MAHFAMITVGTTRDVYTKKQEIQNLMNLFYL